MTADRAPVCGPQGHGAAAALLEVVACALLSSGRPGFFSNQAAILGFVPTHTRHSVRSLQPVWKFRYSSHRTGTIQSMKRTGTPPACHRREWVSRWQRLLYSISQGSIPIRIAQVVESSKVRLQELPCTWSVLTSRHLVAAQRAVPPYGSFAAAFKAFKWLPSCVAASLSLGL